MPAYRDKRRGTWYASFYYIDWQGHRKLKKKRGFETKRDAKAYEEEFLRQGSRSCKLPPIEKIKSTVYNGIKI